MRETQQRGLDNFCAGLRIILYVLSTYAITKPLILLQIEDFPPKKTIVVTPAKMAAFYASHALDKEIHPLVCK
jgi:hypothetical protein